MSSRSLHSIPPNNAVFIQKAWKWNKPTFSVLCEWGPLQMFKELFDLFDKKNIFIHRERETVGIPRERSLILLHITRTSLKTTDNV